MDQRNTRHAVIAGTGRAGTSFLVEWLRTAGVPGPDLGSLYYSEEARAGYETALVDAGSHYLVKDPWLSEYLDHLDDAAVTIEALILPVRDLRDAAVSRLRRQLEDRARSRDSARLQTDASVAGGMIFSLSVDDEERVLAVGQARVITWALERDVPLYLLHYPRLVQDADYAIDALWPWLQRFCDRATATEAFARVLRPPSGDPIRSDGEDTEVVRLREEIRALEKERRRLREALKRRTVRGRAEHLLRAAGLVPAYIRLRDRLRP